MENKVAIVVDSAGDVPESYMKNFNVRRVPLILTFGTEERLDAEQCNLYDVFEYYDKEHELPMTSAPTTEMFGQVFIPLIHQGYRILYLGASSQFSKTYENGKSFEKIFTEKIYAVDTRFTCAPVGLVVRKAYELLQTDLPLPLIVKALNEYIYKIHSVFIINDFNFVKEIGNMNAVTGFFASLMNVKPALELTAEKGVQSIKNYTGHYEKAVTTFIHDVFHRKMIYDDSVLIIAHTLVNSYELERIKKEILDIIPFKEVEFVTAGSVVGSHMGKGALLFCYTEK